MKFFKLIYWEWKPFFKDSRYWIPFFIPPVIFSLSFFIEPVVDQGMLNRFAVFIGAMALSIGADRISLDREKRMLEIVATLPMSRLKVFWGKTVAVVAIPMILWLITLALFSLWWGALVWYPLLEATQWLFWTLSGLSMIMWVSSKAKVASQLGVVFFLTSVFGQEFAKVKHFPLGWVGGMTFVFVLIYYYNNSLWWKSKT